MTVDLRVEIATRLGARAGRRFAAAGRPALNPYDATRSPALAVGWRRGYFAAIAAARQKGGAGGG